MMTPEQKKQMSDALGPHAKKILNDVLDGVEHAVIATRGQVPDSVVVLSLLAEISAVTLGMAQLLSGPDADRVTAAVLERAKREASSTLGGLERALADMPKITNPGNGTVN